MKRRAFIQNTGIIGLITLLGGLPSCDSPFEYSPYDTKVKSKHKDQTARNLAKLKKLETGSQNFKFAVISDNHTAYDELVDAVTALNKRDDIDFVIHGGDLTLSALHKEYTWFSEIIEKLEKPIFTVIGNHDYLSNGGAIYKESFGDFNYTFTYNRCKFVMFDNIIWEKGNQDPDFEWFKSALINNANYDQVIPVSHIPPWGDQYSNENATLFNQIMEERQTALSIHGHHHGFYHDKKYDQVDYLVADDIADRNYLIVTIDHTNYGIEQIFY